LKHLALTPRGSYYADAGYGTLLYRMRTQNMTAGMTGALLEDLRAGAAKYIPDIVIQDLEAEMEMDEHLLRVFVKWSVRGADREMHGNLATQRTTYLNV
jgi:phage baseplate assembly protein W